jgi:hypothetical protein
VKNASFSPQSQGRGHLGCSTGLYKNSISAII